jgi:hypothetical protein
MQVVVPKNVNDDVSCQGIISGRIFYSNTAGIFVKTHILDVMEALNAPMSSHSCTELLRWCFGRETGNEVGMFMRCSPLARSCSLDMEEGFDPDPP